MRRLLSISLLLSLLLLCGCGAGTAPAADSGTVITFSADGASVTGGGARAEGSTVTIGAVGTYTVRGSAENGQLIVDTGDDAMDVTLILDGLSLTNLADAAIYIQQAKNLRRQLRGENLLVSGTEADLEAFDGTASGAALFSRDDLDIEGEGSLEIRGYLNNGIACKDDLDINSGTLSIQAANNGIRASESVQIKGGQVSILSGNDGIKAESVSKADKGYVEVRAGTLQISAGGDGLQAVGGLGKVELSGGSVSIWSAKQAIQAESAFLLSGGELRALSGSDRQAGPTEASLPWLLCSLKGSAGDRLAVGDLPEFPAQRNYKTLLFAAAELPADSVQIRAGDRSVSAEVH